MHRSEYIYRESATVHVKRMDTIHLKRMYYDTCDVHLKRTIRLQKMYHDRFKENVHDTSYGVATASRIDKIIGLFCKRDL